METILVVDDSPTNIDALAGVLRSHYRVYFATNGADAIDIARKTLPDLILLDVMMPKVSGYEVCLKLKANDRTREIPIIFVTALDEPQNEEEGLSLGAVDYLHKPFVPAILLRRVRIHMDLMHHHRLLEDKVRARTRELEGTRLQIIRRLGRAAEYRDNETGMHVVRMSEVAGLIARAIGMNESKSRLLTEAATLHDVGKIGIPDHILLKPGKLDASEWETMKEHSRIGAEIIGDDESDLLRLARLVALNHHERWDGTGYPFGVTGNDIPIEARIVSIADVYDALTSTRPYKRPWSASDAAAYVLEQAGTAFDPDITSHFQKLLPEIDAINKRFTDNV